MTHDLVLSTAGVAPTTSALARPADVTLSEGPQAGAGGLGAHVLRFEGADTGVILTPYLQGADNCQVTLRIRAWRALNARGVAPGLQRVQWQSKLLCELTCTACAAVGPSESANPDSPVLGSTWRACDLIAATVDRTPAGLRYLMKTTGADDEASAVLFDGLGAMVFTVEAGTNGLGSAATGFTCAVAHVNNGG